MNFLLELMQSWDAPSLPVRGVPSGERQEEGREGRGAENNEVSVIYQIRVAASGSIFILLPISFRLPCGNLEIKCTKEEHAFICRCHTKTFL